MYNYIYLLEFKTSQVKLQFKQLMIKGRNRKKKWITQLLAAIDTISKLLQTIENAITFAKLNILHPSIITHKKLIHYYSIIKIKSYTKSNSIHFRNSISRETKL